MVDLTLLNYTEQLNLQAWYFFGFWILSFFVFQPWNWGWAKSVKLGEDDPYRESAAPSPQGDDGAAGSESQPHGDATDSRESGSGQAPSFPSS